MTPPDGFLTRKGDLAHDPIRAAEDKGDSNIRLHLFRSELKSNIQEYADFYHFMMHIAHDNPKEYNVRRVFDPKHPLVRNKYIASWSDGDISQEVIYFTEKTPVGENLLLDGATVTFTDPLENDQDPAKLDLTFDANLTVSSIHLSLHSQHLQKARQKATQAEEEINAFLDKYIYGGISSHDLISSIGETRRERRRRASRDIHVNFDTGPFFTIDILTRVLGDEHFAFALSQLPQQAAFTKSFANEKERRAYLQGSSQFIYQAETVIPHKAVEQFVINLLISIPTKRFTK